MAPDTKRTAQIRPVDGTKIATLLRVGLELDASEQPQKNSLLDQLLINLCSNAAAIRYIRDTESNGWTKFHANLVERFDETQADEIFIGTLPTATKGKVHTPHPTESLTREAIRAHNIIMRILLSPEADVLFSKQTGNKIPEGLLAKAQELWEGLKPPAENLTIDHEMTRSIRASERSWDAIEAQMVSASSILNLSEKYKGKPIPIEILEAFYFTNEAFTWTPGDQDSKPDMIESLFPAGVEKNSVAMWQRYMKALADLASQIPDDSPEKTEIHSVMWRVMDTIDAISKSSVQGEEKNYLEQYFDKEIERMANGEAARKEILLLKEMREIQGRSFEDVFPDFYFKEGGYSQSPEFHTDLIELKLRLEADGVQFPKHVDHKGEETGFTVLDVMVSQVANFRRAATRIQIRQNRDAHAEVFGMLCTSLIDAGFIGHDMSITELLDLVADSETGQLTESGEEISQFMRDKVARMRDEVTELYSEKPYKDFTPREKVRFGFYQTMMTVTHAIENSDAIPKYIVAECSGFEDAITPLLFMKLMHDPEKAATIPGYGLVEVFPLNEYRSHIEDTAKTLLDLDDNPHFRAHKQRIQDQLFNTEPTPGVLQEPADKDVYDGDPALSFYDIEKGKKRPLTVADAKMMHGFEPKPGDEDKLIQRRQTIMVAGSDSRKGHGACIAPIIKYSIADGIEAMLDRGVLMEFFMGSGGGKHRNYPTSAQIHTDQGSNNRHLTAEEIAYNNQKFLSKHQRAMTGEAYPADSPEVREKIESRSASGCRLYEDLYNSSDFSAYVSRGTPCHMAKLVSYAARPSTRTRSASEEDNTYPPKINVKDFRAIQYGAAMNGSGVALGMWYGASAFLGLDGEGRLDKANKDELVDLYKTTRTAQIAIEDMAYGLSLVDMQTAWTFLDCQRSEDGQKIVTRDGVERNLEEIANGADRFPPELCTLAKIEGEYQISARAIHEILVTIKRGRYTDADREQFKPEDIGTIVPGGIQDEMKATSEQIRAARSELSDLHRMLRNEDAVMPVKGMDPEDPNFEKNQGMYERIYYPSATLMEAFEHTPAAMRMREYGQAIEQHQQQAVNGKN